MGFKQEKRGKTLLEHLGFKDAELYTSEHDKGVIKFSNRDFLLNFLTKYFEAYYRERHPSNVASYLFGGGFSRKLDCSNVSQLAVYLVATEKGVEFALEKDVFEVVSVVEEKPAKNAVGNVVGVRKEERKVRQPKYPILREFTGSCVDVKIKLGNYELEVVDDVELVSMDVQLEGVKLEHPLSVGSADSIRYYGFVDIYFYGMARLLTPSLGDVSELAEVPGTRRNFRGFIEVKTNANNVGAILREVNYYRDFFLSRSKEDVMVIPALAFTKPIPKELIDLFESQGIKVLTEG